MRGWRSGTQRREHEHSKNGSSDAHGKTYRCSDGAAAEEPVARNAGAASNESIIAVAGLCVSTARGRELLRDADLQLGPGERIAVLGPSGAGKTTLALAAVGAVPRGLRVWSRQHRVLGVDVRGMATSRRRALRRGRVGYVPQDPAAAAPPTHHIGRAWDAAAGVRGMPIPAELGLAIPDLRRRYLWQLSGGQQRRVALALALASEPELVILDEPTAGLDAATARAVCTWIRERLDASRAAAIVITHDEHVAAMLAERTVHVVDGRLSDVAPIETNARSSGEPGEVVLHATALQIAPVPEAEVRVDGAALDLRAGELTALMGPSGIGKSTLLRGLAGLGDVRAGQVSLDGRVLARRSARRSRAERRAVQWVPQDGLGSLNPEVPVGRAIARVARASGDTEPQRRTAELAAELGLATALLTQVPDELSGGQRQRVLLARALAVQPRVLLCDEVSSALDPASRELVLDALARRAAAGMAVLLATHDLAGVGAACSRRYVLDAEGLHLEN